MTLWLMSGCTVLGFGGVLGGIFGRFTRPRVGRGLVLLGFGLLVAALWFATPFAAQ